MIDLDRGTCLFSKFLDLLFEFLIRGWDLIGRRQHLKLALLRLDRRGLVQRQNSCQPYCNTQTSAEELTASHRMPCWIVESVPDHGTFLPDGRLRRA